MNMFSVIQAGAKAAVKADPKPITLGCPACGTQPTHKFPFYGQHVLFCDNDDCQTLGDGAPQAMGTTIEAAAATWNERAS